MGGRRRPENPLNELIEGGATRLERMVADLPEAEAPPGARAKTQYEQVADYLEMRDDVDAWTELLGERELDEVVEYALTMEKRLERIRGNGDTAVRDDTDTGDE